MSKIRIVQGTDRPRGKILIIILHDPSIPLQNFQRISLCLSMLLTEIKLIPKVFSGLQKVEGLARRRFYHPVCPVVLEQISLIHLVMKALYSNYKVGFLSKCVSVMCLALSLSQFEISMVCPIYWGPWGHSQSRLTHYISSTHRPNIPKTK